MAHFIPIGVVIEASLRASLVDGEIRLVVWLRVERAIDQAVDCACFGDFVVDQIGDVLRCVPFLPGLVGEFVGAGEDVGANFEFVVKIVWVWENGWSFWSEWDGYVYWQIWY